MISLKEVRESFIICIWVFMISSLSFFAPQFNYLEYPHPKLIRCGRIAIATCFSVIVIICISSIILNPPQGPPENPFIEEQITVEDIIIYGKAGPLIFMDSKGMILKTESDSYIIENSELQDIVLNTDQREFSIIYHKDYSDVYDDDYENAPKIIESIIL